MFSRKSIQHLTTVLVIVVVFILMVKLSAALASPITDVKSSIQRAFRHIGSIEHEHSFSAVFGSVRFAAFGNGEVGGSQDAWARESLNRTILNSNEAYTGYTDRRATPDQYVQMGTRYGLARGYSSSISIIISPNQTGRIEQTVSSKSEPGVGHYFKQNNRVEATNSTTIIEGSIGDSVTNIEVEGYTEYREVVIVQSGNVKTGLWDQN